MCLADGGNWIVDFYFQDLLFSAQLPSSLLLKPVSNLIRFPVNVLSSLLFLGPMNY